MPLTPEQRSLRAKLAAHRLHSQTDSKEHLRPARAAFEAKFVDQVDPDRVLPESERQRRARQAMKAYMAGLALKSSRARQKRGEAA